jgi:menaquinone-dependent protoporphyrinogen IX oxidase
VIGILVPAASGYGSTAEISRAIGDVLSGAVSTSRGLEEVVAVEDYDTVILAYRERMRRGSSLVATGQALPVAEGPAC